MEIVNIRGKHLDLLAYVALRISQDPDYLRDSYKGFNRGVYEKIFKNGDVLVKIVIGPDDICKNAFKCRKLNPDCETDLKDSIKITKYNLIHEDVYSSKDLTKHLNITTKL